MSAGAADVRVCAATSGTGAQCFSSERNTAIGSVAQVPRPAVSVLLPTTGSSHAGTRVWLNTVADILRI